MRKDHTPSTKPTLNNREDIIWLAGLLEGEGCFYANDKGNMIVTVTSVDFDVIDKARTVMGGGLYTRSREGKQTFRTLTATNKKYAYAVMCAVYPFMMSRRQEKIRECISKFKGEL